ncbi:hypothetical protein DFJ73DRAFT_794133 [Zopfochytrium polystomum]|nr:hypothetical protein DFJ73DRAFT_794133 [Zopfochytrium polystomum]
MELASSGERRWRSPRDPTGNCTTDTSTASAAASPQLPPPLPSQSASPLPSSSTLASGDITTDIDTATPKTSATSSDAMASSPASGEPPPPTTTTGGVDNNTAASSNAPPSASSEQPSSTSSPAPPPVSSSPPTVRSSGNSCCNVAAATNDSRCPEFLAPPFSFFCAKPTIDGAKHLVFNCDHIANPGDNQTTVVATSVVPAQTSTSSQPSDAITPTPSSSSSESTSELNTAPPGFPAQAVFICVAVGAAIFIVTVIVAVLVWTRVRAAKSTLAGTGSRRSVTPNRRSLLAKDESVASGDDPANPDGHGESRENLAPADRTSSRLLVRADDGSPSIADGTTVSASPANEFHLLADNSTLARNRDAAGAGEDQISFRRRSSPLLSVSYPLSNSYPHYSYSSVAQGTSQYNGTSLQYAYPTIGALALTGHEVGQPFLLAKGDPNAAATAWVMPVYPSQTVTYTHADGSSSPNWISQQIDPSLMFQQQHQLQLMQEHERSLLRPSQSNHVAPSPPPGAVASTATRTPSPHSTTTSATTTDSKSEAGSGRNSPLLERKVSRRKVPEERKKSLPLSDRSSVAAAAAGSSSSSSSSSASSFSSAAAQPSHNSHDHAPPIAPFLEPLPFQAAGGGGSGSVGAGLLVALALDPRQPSGSSSLHARGHRPVAAAGYDDDFASQPLLAHAAAVGRDATPDHRPAALDTVLQPADYARGYDEGGDDDDDVYVGDEYAIAEAAAPPAGAERNLLPAPPSPSSLPPPPAAVAAAESGAVGARAQRKQRGGGGAWTPSRSSRERTSVESAWPSIGGTYERKKEKRRKHLSIYSDDSA